MTAFGVDPDRIVVGRNTVDLDVYRSRESGPNDPGRRTAFVYVGQLIDRKNVPTLIAALALAPEDYTLDIIGEGPSEAAIRHAVNESGLHGRVTLHGYLEPKAIADVLDRMATLVLPSTEEVYGIAPAEALAAGLHVIVSERAGIKVDITEMAGVRVTAPTADALAAAMTSSSLAWNGPIPSPVIRRWTPERFAHEVLAATDIARQRTRPRRRPTRENRARRHADQR